MTVRERLIELINKTQLQCDDNYGMINSEQMADYLLSNSVIIPPCKLSTTCFVINDFLKDADKIILGTIVGFGVYKDGMTMYISYTNESISDERLVSDFGKTVFLTYEEAEKTLKEREDNDKTLQFIAEEISSKYNTSFSEAQKIVAYSFLPKILKEMPDYVQHYDAKYWADEIMKDRERE